MDPDEFFSECDLDPRQVDHHNIQVVAEALCTVAEVVGRSLWLIVEGMPGESLAIVEPGGRVVVDTELCKSWEEHVSARYR
jgi:hypothetical protein